MAGSSSNREETNFSSAGQARARELQPLQLPQNYRVSPCNSRLRPYPANWLVHLKLNPIQWEYGKGRASMLPQWAFSVSRSQFDCRSTKRETLLLIMLLSIAAAHFSGSGLSERLR